MDRAFDEDPAFQRTYLVVELTQEAEPDQPFDSPTFWQILSMDSKIARLVPQTIEPIDPDHVALLVTNGRAHHGDLFTLAWIVPELVEGLWSDDRLRGARIQDES